MTERLWSATMSTPNTGQTTLSLCPTATRAGLWGESCSSFRLSVGVDDVRVKLNKSKLSKGSDDNWSKTLYKIGKVMRKQEHTSRALQTCEESEGERRRKKSQKRFTEWTLGDTVSGPNPPDGQQGDM